MQSASPLLPVEFVHAMLPGSNTSVTPAQVWGAGDGQAPSMSMFSNEASAMPSQVPNCTANMSMFSNQVSAMPSEFINLMPNMPERTSSYSFNASSEICNQIPNAAFMPFPPTEMAATNQPLAFPSGFGFVSQAGVGSPTAIHASSLPSQPQANFIESSCLHQEGGGIASDIASTVPKGIVCQSLSPVQMSSDPTLSNSHSSFTPMRCKRKALDVVGDGAPVTKVHINEDRMASCLNDLHLDNNNSSWQPDLEEQPWFRTSDASADSLSCIEALRSSDAHPNRRRIVINDRSTLEFCHGLEMNPTNKDFIPKLIRDELNKSSMQIVLWKPPGDTLQKMLDMTSRSVVGSGVNSGVSSSHTSSSSSASSSYSDSSDDEPNARRRVRMVQLLPSVEQQLSVKDVSTVAASAIGTNTPTVASASGKDFDMDLDL